LWIEIKQIMEIITNFLFNNKKLKNFKISNNLKIIKEIAILKIWIQIKLCKIHIKIRTIIIFIYNNSNNQFKTLKKIKKDLQIEIIKNNLIFKIKINSALISNKIRINFKLNNRMAIVILLEKIKIKIKLIF
jgi:hypothetical protein